MNMQEPPIGIIKTMPIKWLNESHSIEHWERSMLKMNHCEGHYWIYNLTGKPKYDVLYFYLLYDRAIRFRMNIIGYEGPEKIKCYSGEVRYGRCWIQVAAPVIKLKEPVPMKGFQGFRYTTEIYG
jgi:hypothetical protein